MSAVGQARRLWKNRMVLRLSVKENGTNPNGGEGCLTIGFRKDAPDRASHPNVRPTIAEHQERERRA